MIDFKKLIENNVHFGHQTARWCPLMAPYIWGHRRGVHLIDVSKTAVGLEKAAQFLQEVAAQGKPVFWVGTKKAAQRSIEQAGATLNMPYVTHRWVGGTLTNNAQVKKAVTKLLHYEDVLAKSADFNYTKKELNTFQKIIERLKNTIGGIVSLSFPLGAVVIVDVKKEQTALREAVNSGISVVALVDTNSDPSLVDYIIPGNDDSPKSIELIVNYLVAATQEGQKAAGQRKKEERAAKEKEVAAKAKEKVVTKEVKKEIKPAKKEEAEKSASEKKAVVPKEKKVDAVKQAADTVATKKTATEENK